MQHERILYLVNQLAGKQISPDEKAELRELLNTQDLTALTDIGVSAWLNEQLTEDTQQPDDVLEQQAGVILSLDKTDDPFGKVAHRVHFLKRWGWAAAVLLFIAGGAYLYTSTTKTEKPILSQQQKSDESIVPGTNKAMLTLSDGTTITLDSAANGAIAQQGNSSVIKLANGEIRYDVKGLSPSKVMMNTMTTPKGGQYQLLLPDGSRVWLNAASSITYPAAFAGNDRRVKVSGEVYMEVAKDKTKAFIVDVAGKGEVMVLGTSFNINAYADEGDITTTLVDGSIKINQRTVLKPGQQATQLITAEKIHVQTANVAQVLAWKNGLFNLEGADIKEVMNQIARWYDLEIVYEGEIPPVRFVGKLPRSLPLAELLTVLEDFEVRFRLEGRRLTVLP